MDTDSAAQPVAMDKLASSAYADLMFARLVAMLAILAVFVVSTVTSAHAARMRAASDHAVDDGRIQIGMMYTPGISEHSCDGEQHCGSIESGLCKFVCAGLSAFITSPIGEAGQVYGRASHDQPSAAILVSRMPSLSERPPKLRLL
ncbi:MAG: hypothetical protein Q8K28_04530 [Hoeflea sp.]|uniref:hypothetical protein n=1 Tax=Hoeflea sp. TaxID=1940281 RepID=UPI00272FC827|nr:hypothetical protein [Hoeflea sp.]MDP2119149.1 hypothetical protein [Hoeflea sp.]